MAELSTFDPGIHEFLRSVWMSRGQVPKDRGEGPGWIYENLYSPGTPVNATRAEVEMFIGLLRSIAGARTTSIQSLYAVDIRVVPQAATPDPRSLLLSDIRPNLTANLGAGKVVMYCRNGQLVDLPYPFERMLGRAFYHVEGRGGGGIRKRLYVHAAGVQAGLAIMRTAVTSLHIPGFAEVKIAGPREINRPDTIVAYFATDEARRTVLDRLKELQKGQPAMFRDSLPGPVHREAPGIGSADEPPEIEILPGAGNRSSFGTFMSTLVWIALHSLPPPPPSSEMRHFLDNLLFSFRALQVDPLHPQKFPQAAALEALQAAHGP